MVQFFVVDGYCDTGKFSKNSLINIEKGIDFGNVGVGDCHCKEMTLVNVGNYKMIIEIENDIHNQHLILEVVHNKQKEKEKNNEKNKIQVIQENIDLEDLEELKETEEKKQHHTYQKKKEKEELIHRSHQKHLHSNIVLESNGGKCTIKGTWTPEGRTRLETSFVIRTSMPSGSRHYVVKMKGKGKN